MPEAITNNLDLWTSALLAKSTAGRGSNGKHEAYGVKKLRKLILELAVRGKLVPQDPNDEPASTLLEKIAKNKAKLIKAGKLRNEKQLPEITEDDKPYELPNGWEWSKLGNLFDIQDSRRIPINSAERALREGQYPYYGANGQVGFIDDYLFEGQRILIAEDGGFFDDPIRGVAYVVDGKFWVNNHAHVLECLSDTNAKYWVSYFNRMDWQSLVRGMTRDKLNQAAMIQIVMAVPPLQEQHRIAYKVDELMALCDQLEKQQANSIEAHQTLVEILLGTLTRVESEQELTEAWTRIADHFDTLFTTEQSIYQLKQAILQLAVMGKLVLQDSNDEPASVLLEKIAKERKRLFKEGKIKKQEPLPETGDDNKTFELPQGWAWGFIPQVVTNDKYAIKRGPFGSSIRKNFFVASGYKVYEQQHAIKDDFSLGEYYIDGDKFKELKAFEVKPNDLIISCSGTVGKVAIAPSWMEPGIINQALLKLSLNENALTNVYFKILFPAFYMKTETLSDLQGTAQKNMVSVDTLRKEPFPLPPRAEQQRIVAKVDELMALCDALKVRLNDAQTTRIYLADAIVEQAVA